jgi:hypothetical protein
MPYTTSSSNLPESVKKASSAARAQWVHVWNDSYTQAKKDGKSDKEAEGIAFRNANGVLKKREAHMGLLNFAATKTKTEDGQAFPAAAYAYVPDPSKPDTWKLRLWESPTKKETAHQVGAAVAAFTNFRGNKVEIPAKDLAGAKARVRSAWKRVNPGKSADDMPDSIKMSACFSVRDDEAGVVRRWGKLFEAGDYKGHKFAMTPEEVNAVPDTFQPVNLNMQHGPSILDDKLGSLEEVQAEDGILFGRVDVPIWLDEAIGDRPFTVSTEWDRPTKRLAGLAIEVDPAVEDAVLFAAKKEAGQDPVQEEAAEIARIQALPMPALDQPIVEQLLATFAARHDTYSGQSAIQDIHDTAARYGAVCEDPGKDAKMQSKHEATALQATHDMMMEHGAKCSSKTSGSGSAPWMFKAEPVVHGEESDAGNTEHKERSRMSKIMDEIKAMLARAGVDPDAETEDPKTPAASDPKPSADTTVDMAANTEIVRLRAENARLQEERQTEAAEKFAEDVIRDGRATPAEKPSIVEMHVQAARDDLVTGKVMLANGQQGTRLDKLAALFAAKPKFNLADERLKGIVHTAIVNLAKTDETEKEDLSAETIRKLAEATPAGKAAFAAKNGAAAK